MLIQESHLKQNEAQTTKEFMSARKTSHKHANRDLSCLRKLSPGMPVNTNYVSATDAPVVEFIVYLILLTRTVGDSDLVLLNPFTTPACKTSGLKSAHLQASKQYI